MTDLKPDMVNRPPHYQIREGLEVIDVRDALLDKLDHLVKDGKMTCREVDYFSRAWEYITRAPWKNDIEDFEKCVWYTERLVRSLRRRKAALRHRDVELNPSASSRQSTPIFSFDGEPLHDPLEEHIAEV